MTVTADAGVVSPSFISSSALLEHWQGPRRLTRRVIDAFPEDRLLGYSVACLRPFGTLAMELISIAEPMVRGIVTADWTRLEHPPASSKDEVLRLWDESTLALDRLWPHIPPERFQETMNRVLTSAASG